MKTSWTKGKNPELSKEIRASFAGSVVMRKRLQEVVRGKIEESLSTKEDDYDNPSWAYKQADSVGYRRALKEINSLLE